MWLAKVCNVQLATWAQHSENLSECPALVVAGQMMQHQTGQYAVKGLIGVRQLKSHAVIPLDVGACSFRFGFCQIEHLRITVNTDHVCCRMKCLEHNGQRAGAATQVEHALAWLDVR